MEPTSTLTQTNTEYAGYLYTSVNALGGITTCTGAESVLASGASTLRQDHQQSLGLTTPRCSWLPRTTARPFAADAQVGVLL